MKSFYKVLLLSTIAIGATISIQAQSQNGASSKGEIAGKVTRPNNAPVEFATVTLLRAKDSVLVKGVLADIAGKYAFEGVPRPVHCCRRQYGAEEGIFPTIHAQWFACEYAGYRTWRRPRNLKAVEVTAKRPFIEQKADKMVINVENSIVAAGGTALEVLQQSPASRSIKTIISPCAAKTASSL